MRTLNEIGLAAVCVAAPVDIASATMKGNRTHEDARTAPELGSPGKKKGNWRTGANCLVYTFGTLIRPPWYGGGRF